MWLGCEDASIHWLREQILRGNQIHSGRNAGAGQGGGSAQHVFFAPPMDFLAKDFPCSPITPNCGEALQQAYCIASEHRVQRVIISLTRRLDIGPLMESLTTVSTEIPTAIALGEWFDGSRRTGHGETPWLQLPWHRYWDAWRLWLNTPSPQLFTLPVAPASPLLESRRVDFNSGMSTTKTVIVACDQLENYLVWQRVFATFGMKTLQWRSQDLQNAIASGDLHLNEDTNESLVNCFLLTDHIELHTDTELHRNAPEPDQHSARAIQAIRAIRRLSKAAIVYSCTIPRGQQWAAIAEFPDVYPVSALSTITGIEQILAEIPLSRM